MPSPRVVALFVVAALTLAPACTSAPKPRPPRPVAQVRGLRVLLAPVAEPTMATTGCPDGVVTSVPTRLASAARSALSNAGFAVVDDAAQEHLLEARIDSEIAYCNGDVGIANGSAGLALVKNGAVIHRSDGTGELSSQTSATSLLSDLVAALVHDDAVIRAVEDARTGK